MSAPDWEDVPNPALISILLEVGLASLPDALLVCKRWHGADDQDGFWLGVVRREFGVVQETLPRGFVTWKRFAQFLHQQRTYLVELGSNVPTPLRCEDQFGAVECARGLKDVRIEKVVDGTRTGHEDLFLGTCVTAAGEILLWFASSPTQTVRLADASNSYSAPFKGRKIVSQHVQGKRGVLVLTRQGDLFKTRPWPVDINADFHVEFERLPLVSRVVSFDLCSAGVGAAVLDDGSVHVWGEIQDPSMEDLDARAIALFGLGLERPIATYTSSVVSIATPQRVLFDQAAKPEPEFVQVVAGKAHFLVRSNSGDVWAWGFGGFNNMTGSMEINSLPIRAARGIQKIHSGSVMECTRGNLYTYLEFVCGGETRPIWTPMYNFQYGPSSKPSSPNAWPWTDGKLGVVRAHSRDLSEMPLDSPVPMSSGCVGFSVQNAGCIRIHIHIDEEFQTWRDPVQITPMFDVGPSLSFCAQGNMYFGRRGQIVVKDIQRPAERDRFYLVDLRSLGIQQELHSVYKPCGGLVLVMVG